MDDNLIKVVLVDGKRTEKLWAKKTEIPNQVTLANIPHMSGYNGDDLVEHDDNLIVTRVIEQRSKTCFMQFINIEDVTQSNLNLFVNLVKGTNLEFEPFVRGLIAIEYPLDKTLDDVREILKDYPIEYDLLTY